MDNLSELFESIYDFSASDRPMYRYAKRKHDDTNAVRKHSGEKYFIHPESVAKIAKAYGGTDIEVKSALSHDLVEDAGADLNDIREKFGDKVADIVEELTNDTYKIKNIGNDKYMDMEIENFSHFAFFVKLCDILDNSLDYPSIELKSRFLNNLIFLTSHRKLTNRENELVDSINSAS